MKLPVLKKAQKLCFCCLYLLFLASCAIKPTVDNWPENVPDREIFVAAYAEQNDGISSNNELENHLVWIKRFYRGSIIYPLGWNRVSQMVLESVEDEATMEDLKPRLYELGLKICIEWAQDNDKRKIDSSAVAVWGNSLRTASENMEQIEFISRVEADVNALLADTLKLQEIKRERYYPPEDYDNF